MEVQTKKRGAVTCCTDSDTCDDQYYIYNKYSPMEHREPKRKVEERRHKSVFIE